MAMRLHRSAKLLTRGSEVLFGDVEIPCRIEKNRFSAQDGSQVDRYEKPQVVPEAGLAELPKQVDEDPTLKFAPKRELSHEDNAAGCAHTNELGQRLLDLPDRRQCVEDGVDHDDVEGAVGKRDLLRRAQGKLHVGNVAEHAMELLDSVRAGIHASTRGDSPGNEAKERSVSGAHVEYT
jgi:hypothetical protein